MLLPANAGTLLYILIITCVVILCNGQHLYNISDHIETVEDVVHIMAREPRLFRFNKKKDDTNVELEFKVPFGTIPVMFFKNKAESFGKSMVNGNMISYALAAMTTIGGAMKSGIPSFSYMPRKADKHQRLRLISDVNSYGDEISILGMLETMQVPFKTYSKNLRNCLQKTVCLLVKRSAENSENGESESIDKIVDGITSLEWVLEIFADTVLKTAIDNGKNKVDCTTVYKSCFFKEETLLGYFNGF